MKLKVTVEYNGSKFSGWQLQEGVLTVQGAIEEALGIIIRSESKRRGLETPEIPKVIASGRTDRGVHALGQVVSFEWPERLDVELSVIRRSLNGLMRHLVYCRDIANVPDSFDARHSPHLKSYTYRLRTRSGSVTPDSAMVWCVGELDVASMIRAARGIVGTHDFSSFRASDCMAKSTERTILVSELAREASSHAEGDLVYTICGKGFLKQMVRIIVGTLVDIGRGWRGESEIVRLLSACERGQAGTTAPPHGLTLEWVRYLEKNYWD